MKEEEYNEFNTQIINQIGNVGWVETRFTMGDAFVGEVGVLLAPALKE